MALSRTTPLPPAGPTTEADPGRRRFLGLLVAAPTLAAAAELGLGAVTPAAAAIPSGPQPPEIYDLNDMLTDAARATSNLITVVVNEDGTASFALPRSEIGQGVTTSTRDADRRGARPAAWRRSTSPSRRRRPELVFNQLTGGSNTTISTFTPIRVAAAIAKGALLRGRGHRARRHRREPQDQGRRDRGARAARR